MARRVLFYVRGSSRDNVRRRSHRRQHRQQDHIPADAVVLVQLLRVVHAAVQLRHRHNVVAGACDGQDRVRDRRLPRAERQRRKSTLERGDALLEHVLRRVESWVIRSCSMMGAGRPRLTKLDAVVRKDGADAP